MNFLNKLERKLGRFAIPNLSKWLIVTYVIGYVLAVFAPGISSYLQLEPFLILQGQVWRLVTWVLIPPEQSNVFFYLIMLMLYYSLGTALEQQWGTFRFNVYIFGGMIFTILGAFLTYGIYMLTGEGLVPIGLFVSTSYINMSIFLAFAVCFPNLQLLLFFIIPVKMKWMAVVYGAMTIYQLIAYDYLAIRISIVAALLNFLIFYFATRNYKSISPKEIHRKKTFKRKMREAQYPNGGISRHKCAVCGITEKDDPTMQFRFCSKCEGNYEYCQNHLFTHEHIKRGSH